MQIKLKMLSLIMAFGLSNLASAADISGLWQSIDDKTGAPKGLVRALILSCISLCLIASLSKENLLTAGSAPA